MRYTLLYIATFLLVLTARAESDSVFVERALAATFAGNPQLHYARLLLGRPYVAHTLEAPGKERLIVNLRQLDCTTLVENVAALTLCHNAGQKTFAHFKAALTRLRYAGGRIDGYPSRLHYFTSWIDDNTALGLVREVQQPKSVFSAVQTVHADYMSTHPKSYSALKVHPEYLPAIREAERKIDGRQFRYIPKSRLANTKAMRHAIADGDIIAITTNKRGLEIAHLGFAVWRTDGLHLLNASQIHKKVVEEPMTLRQYLQKHPSHTGIRVVRMEK